VIQAQLGFGEVSKAKVPMEERNAIGSELPTLDAINDVSIGEDSPEQIVNLTGISAGGSRLNFLRVTASSSNPELIPHPKVSYDSLATTGTLAFAPVPGAKGTATITVAVEAHHSEDDSGTTNDSVRLNRTFDVRIKTVIKSSVVFKAVLLFVLLIALPLGVLLAQFNPSDTSAIADILYWTYVVALIVPASLAVCALVLFAILVSLWSCLGDLWEWLQAIWRALRNKDVREAVWASAKRPETYLRLLGSFLGLAWRAFTTAGGISFIISVILTALGLGWLTFLVDLPANIMGFVIGLAILAVVWAAGLAGATLLLFYGFWCCRKVTLWVFRMPDEKECRAIDVPHVYWSYVRRVAAGLRFKAIGKATPSTGEDSSDESS
jgi:hypothetical protein